MTRVTRNKTGHLIEITRDDGTKDVSWDWDQLLADVRAATADRKVLTVDLGELTPAEEAKVIKKVTKAVKAKKDTVKESKPAAKKPATKKPAAKKKKETK